MRFKDGDVLSKQVDDFATNVDHVCVDNRAQLVYTRLMRFGVEGEGQACAPVTNFQLSYLMTRLVPFNLNSRLGFESIGMKRCVMEFRRREQ